MASSAAARRVLFPPVTAGMARQQAGPIQDVEVKGIRFDDHLAPGAVHRCRIAVRLVDNQAVAVETGAGRHTTLVGIGGEAAQHGSLPLPHLPDRLHLPADAALVIFETGVQQAQVQLLKRGHGGDRHEKIAAAKPHRCLHPPFLPSRGRLAEMALEQIVRAESHELPLLAAHPAFHHQADGGRQVIVADAGRHAPKVLESADMSVKEALLFLAGKGHHKASSAVGQPHHKDLHGLPDPADDGDGLSPIHLRILAGVKLQRQKQRRGVVALVPLRQVQAYPRLTALIALGLQQFVDFVARVLLLGRQMHIFGQQFVGAGPNPRTPGTASRGLAGRAVAADCRPLYPRSCENGCVRGRSVSYSCLPGSRPGEWFRVLPRKSSPVLLSLKWVDCSL